MTPNELARIHAAAFTQARPWSAKEFTDLVQSPHVHLTANPAGFALWRAVAGEAELMTIAVAPEYQGKGHGDALMRAWMTAARDLAETAFLEVAADNHAALRLYEKAGFTTNARRRAYYPRDAGESVDAIVMRATLAAIIPQA